MLWIVGSENPSKTLSSKRKLASAFSAVLRFLSPVLLRLLLPFSDHLISQIPNSLSSSLVPLLGLAILFFPLHLLVCGTPCRTFQTVFFPFSFGARSSCGRALGSLQLRRG